jgi:hypothetical protein
MSVEGDPGFWKWLATTITSTVVGIFGYHKYIEGKIEKKADRHVVNNQLQEIKNEQATQRGHIGKIFDQMRDAEKASEERHRELLMHLIEKKGS